MDILEKAIIFATEKHSGALRKGTNKPYIIHPLEAGAIAATMTDDREIIAAAVLHDTIEDTDTTEKELRCEFGERVTALVSSDSENKREERPAGETWKIRKQETLDYIETAKREEQIIVLADKLSNLRAIYRDQKALGDKFWLRFNQKDKREHGWYYCGVAKRLTTLFDTDAYEELKVLTEKVFGHQAE